MRKTFLLFLGLSFCNLTAQQKMKDYSGIMRSKNIYEIDAFLRDAHPDDPKRIILKPRLIGLLKDYIKVAQPEDQRVKEFQKKIALLRSGPSTKINFGEMSAETKKRQIAKYKQELDSPVPSYNVNASEEKKSGNTAEEEFKMLMSASPIDHKNKTVKILNTLFDNDPKSQESIVMFENKSDCNIIVRIEGIGHTRYRLAVPAKGDNSIVITKGDYVFSSNVCNAQYASQKTVDKTILVSLSSPGT